MKTLKNYLPYMIGTLLIIVVGVMKRHFKQTKHTDFREHNTQRMNDLKDSLKDLGSGNTTATARAVR